MYTREQASQVKQVFWTKFGKYMAPVLSANGEKINWINYKTGIRNLKFCMNVTSEEAYIGIEIQHKNPTHASKIYDQFVLLKPKLEEVLDECWHWERICEKGSDHFLSRISIRLQSCDIRNESSWAIIISFLKPRIIALDKFWCEYSMIFEGIE
jgi:hypothetical protein